ncbi:TPA: phosphomannomutase/phosphoglucomutase [Candidatus Ventrenecus avicola]|nr:phosphomannomutase/phosphoglucomutase [Candidatus Ventrenecus avicola]
MNESIFKAYDIRGNYPNDINEKVAYIIGQSYGTYLQKYCDKRKCVIGCDNRLSSPSLIAALKEGLLDSGINVIDYGMITTPMHYYSRYIENTYGIMVTASHNPKDDNGFKFSFDPIANARGDMIEDFKDFTLKGEFYTGSGMYEKRDIKNLYLNYLKDNIFMGDKKIKVVFDCGNGVTSTIIRDSISIFPNIDATYICSDSDGTFPNHHPDPAVENNMAMLKEKVLETKADIGIAFDGDGDRLGIIDENGKFVMADKYLIVAMRDMIQFSKRKTFLCDVKCSKSFIDEVEKLGGTVFMSRTGTSFTEANTKENHIPLGGELSGHIFFNDRGPEVCSAIYAGLRFIEILSKTNKNFSELLKGITEYYSTPEIKVHCSNETKFDVVEKVKQYVKQKGYSFLDIDGVRVNFEESWGLIRASNTGPDLTLRFEATTEEELESIKKEFTDVVNSFIEEH